MKLTFTLIFLFIISNCCYSQIKEAAPYCASEFKDNYNSIHNLIIKETELTFGTSVASEEKNSYLYYNNFSFPNVKQGEKTSIEVNFSTIKYTGLDVFSFGLPSYFGIWIDFNQNKVFEDSELILQNSNSIEDRLKYYMQHKVTAKISIPDNAKLGLTRGRIIRTNKHRTNLPLPNGSTLLYDPNFKITACNIPEDTDKSFSLSSKNSGCTYDFNIMITGGTLGLDTSPIATKKITIGPNPIKNILKIDKIDISIKLSKIEIYSITGKKVFQQKTLNKDQHTINIGNLSSGIYFAKIYEDNGSYTNFKLLK